VTIEFQGRNASGRYSISRGAITVSTIFYGHARWWFNTGEPRQDHAA
jgi:hypothetical protein